MIILEKEKLLDLKTAQIDKNTTGFTVTLYSVSSGNFNDERQIDNLALPLDDIKDKPLKFFDPFFGRQVDEPVKAAIAYYSDGYPYLILERNGQKTVEHTAVITAKDTTDSRAFYVCHVYTFLSNY